jgi:hypothetical protein
MVKTPFFPIPRLPLQIAGSKALRFWFFLKASRDSNSDWPEKLRQQEWLISAILHEISQLEEVDCNRKG